MTAMQRQAQCAQRLLIALWIPCQCRVPQLRVPGPGEVTLQLRLQSPGPKVAGLFL